MNIDEVMKISQALGINTSITTIRRYWEVGLIPSPDEGTGSKGRGNSSNFHNSTPYQLFASHSILKKDHAKLEQAVEARRAFEEYIPFGPDWFEHDKYESRVNDRVEEEYDKRLDRSDERWIKFAEDIAKNEFSIGLFNHTRRFQRLISTPFAMQWWEYKQIAEGGIDEEYMEVCWRNKWTGPVAANRNHIDDVVNKIKKIRNELHGLIVGIDKLYDSVYGSDEEHPDYPALMPLGCWKVLYKMYAEPPQHITAKLKQEIYDKHQQLILRAMKMNYDEVNPQVLEWVIKNDRVY